MSNNSFNNSDTDPSLPLVIVNPTSASGSTKKNWAGIAADLRTGFGPFAVETTKYGGHAAVIGEEAARNGRRFIIACGGDGTINEVANGIIRSGTDAELGVLPAGTGGDFRRTLGLAGSTRQVAAQLKNGNTRSIDVGKVSYRDADGAEAERYFLNVSSVGLAPSVLKRVKNVKAFDWLPSDVLRGKVNYAVSALQSIFDHEPVVIRVSVDGKDAVPLQTIAFCVANSRFFGGGMKIAPKADLQDGMFEVINVGDLSAARILTNIHTLYRGTHESLKEVKTMRARRIEVSSDSSDIKLEIDGEIAGQLPAAFELIPESLKVRVPAKR